MASLLVEIEDELDLAYGLFEFVCDLDVGESRVCQLNDLRLDRGWFRFLCNGLRLVFLRRLIGRFDPSCHAGLTVFKVLFNASAIEE